MKATMQFFLVDPTEIEQLTGAASKPAFKLPVRTADGTVYAIAHGDSMVEVLRRAHAIAAAEALILDSQRTTALLSTCATVLAQAGKMHAARALDDRYSETLRALHRAKGGA